jgi:hypothetical protein
MAFKEKCQVRCKLIIVRSLHNVHETHTKVVMSVRPSLCVIELENRRAVLVNT